MKRDYTYWLRLSFVLLAPLFLQTGFVHGKTPTTTSKFTHITHINSATSAADFDNPQQFTAAVTEIVTPTCSFASPGYANNGSFKVTVTDGSGCVGTYTLNAVPVAGSAPDGSTPVQTNVTTYIGFPAGNYPFSNAGPGHYQVTVRETGGLCNPAKNPLVFIVTVPDGAAGGVCDIPNPQQFTAAVTEIVTPTCSFASPGYANNGSFKVTVTDGSGCVGTYTLNAVPVAGSAPDGSTPVQTNVTTYIGFPAGNYPFSNAGPGQYQVTVRETGALCNPAKNPLVFIVTVPDGAAGGVCDIPNPQQFTAAVTEIVTPTCSFASPGYANNGSFEITVTNGSGCVGTYTLNAVPVAGSGPGGSTPVPTNVTNYIGFPAGNFPFSNAGPGQYQVTVRETGALCNPAKNPLVFIVTVPDGAAGGVCDIPNPQQFTVATTNVTAPTCSFASPGYANNGSFEITVTNGSGCVGTYTLNAVPVAGSAPDGSTPVPTNVTNYIGFPAGNFPFANASPGQYQVTVRETGALCNPAKNPLVFIVTVPDGAAGGVCGIPNPQQFTAAVTEIVTPTCPYDSPCYANDGSFEITATDGSACVGAYTLNAVPVAGSAPDGSTPVPTNVTNYIGFPAGNFSFTNASPGQYQVTVRETGSLCNPAKNPITFIVTVPDGPLVMIGADQRVCSTKIPQPLTTTALRVSSEATITYQWEASTTDCVRDFTAVPNANTTTLTFTSPLTQTTYFRLRVTSTRGDIMCDIFSNCVTITVQKVDCGAFPWNGN